MKELNTMKHAFQNWKQLKCKLFTEHDYVLEKKYTEDILKLQCKNCHKEFGVNLESAMIFAWDEDLKLSLLLIERNFENVSSEQQAPINSKAMKVAV